MRAPEPANRLFARLFRPIFVFSATAILGFGVLSIWDVADQWPVGLPGLFAYRSATVGDGLLISTAAALLTLVCRRLPSAPKEWSCVLAAAAAGATAGALVVADWLSDSAPHLNWTLTRPHHMTAPGYYHAVFLIAMAGTLSGLAVAAARRVRAARADERLDARFDPIQIDAVVTLLLYCLAGYAGLAGLDNSSAASTASGIATAAALGFGLALGVGLVGFALGRELATRAHAVLLGLAGAAGLVAGSVAAPKQDWAALAGLALSALGVTVACAVRQRSLGRLALRVRSLVTATIILGGGLLATAAVSRHATWALLAIAVSSIATVIINPPGQERHVTAILTYAGGIASPVAFSVAAYWLGTTTQSANAAAAVAGAASLIIDVFVFYLLRDRLTGLFSEEKHAVGRHSERASVLDEGIYTWVEVLALGVPAVVTILLIYARAARAVGVDRGGVGSFGGASQMATVAVGVAVMATLSAYLGHRRRRTPTVAGLHQPLRPQVFSLLIGWLACAAWVAYLLGTWRRPTHEVVAAIVVVATLAYLSAEDLSSTPVRLSLADPGWWGWSTIIVVATTVATTLTWLSADAMWSGRHPLSTGWVTFKVVFSLVPLAVLVGSLGCTLADGIQGPFLTLQSPQANMALGQASYTMLALLAVAVPAYIASRLGAGRVTDAGVLVLGNLGALPALMFSYAWIMDNNMEHLARERATAPRREYQAYLPDSENQRIAAHATQIARLRGHVYQQNYLSVAVIAVAVLWIAARLT